MKKLIIIVFVSILLFVSCNDNLIDNLFEENFTFTPFKPKTTIDDCYYQGNSLFGIGKFFTDQTFGYIIYQSYDNGNSWHELVRIAQDSLIMGDFSWAGSVRNFTITDIGNYLFTQDLYLYLSKDKGKSWERLNNPVGSSKGKTEFELFNVQGIYTDQLGNLFLTSYWEGIFKSTDNGTTWNYIDKITNRDNPLYHFQVIDNVILKYKIGDYLYVSFDGANSWMIANGIEKEELCKDINKSVNYFFAIKGKDSNLYIYLYYDDKNESLIYTSMDDGLSWKKINVNNNDISFSELIYINKKGEIFATAFDNNLNYSTPFIYKSTDDGHSWSLYVRMNTGYGVSLVTEDGHVLSLEFHGVWKSKFTLD